MRPDRLEIPSKRNGNGLSNDEREPLYSHYYGAALEWAWEVSWGFASSKVLWSIPVVVAGVILGEIRAARQAKMAGNTWRINFSSGVTGGCTAVAAQIVVLLVLLAVNVVRFPPIHQENIAAVERRVDSLEHKPVAVPDLERRLSTLETGNSNLAAGLNRMESQVHALALYQERLAQKASTLFSLRKMEYCRDKVAPLLQQLDSDMRNIRATFFPSKALVGNEAMVASATRYDSEQDWTKSVRNLGQLSKNCVNRGIINTGWKPDEADVERPVVGEPTSTDLSIDQMHQFRRWQLEATYIIGRASELRNEIVAAVDQLERALLVGQ